ncbi:G-protein coupled receptors family 3 profile domain-containing protein [Plasmodiophora brassicae]|uniref:G-protein coupled receptors family 3 profile domain-containing protein n=1 Tax=Plasmodiophora brassicae TaxID=37360 RepID=A0A0G4IIH3_PLABS|nr:hypothetical protein PBRA_003693 [Plasmodiophora brassicae]SPQ94212.1 unnamed protein product [Plasmodiophora brassicae]
MVGNIAAIMLWGLLSLDAVAAVRALIELCARPASSVMKDVRSKRLVALQVVSLTLAVTLIVISTALPSVVHCIIRPVANVFVMCFACSSAYALYLSGKKTMSGDDRDDEDNDDDSDFEVIIPTVATLVLSIPTFVNYAVVKRSMQTLPLHNGSNLEHWCPMDQLIAIGLPVTVFGVLSGIAIVVTLRLSKRIATPWNMVGFAATVSAMTVLLLAVQIKPSEYSDIAVAYVWASGSLLLLVFLVTAGVMGAVNKPAPAIVPRLHRRTSVINRARPHVVSVPDNTNARTNAYPAHNLVSGPVMSVMDQHHVALMVLGHVPPHIDEAASTEGAREANIV